MAFPASLQVILDSWWEYQDVNLVLFILQVIALGVQLLVMALW